MSKHRSKQTYNIGTLPQNNPREKCCRERDKVIPSSYDKLHRGKMSNDKAKQLNNLTKSVRKIIS